MSVTQQALLRSALCLRAQADCNATGRLPCKCFLKFEILALFTRPSVGNLQSEKHTANGLLGPGAWSHSVYISLTQFENNAIWHKRQVDEMSESFFFLLLLGIIVEWVEQSHGKAESWLQLLAPRLTSCDSGQETWLQPQIIPEQTGRRVVWGFVQAPVCWDFRRLGRLPSRQQPSHTHPSQSPQVRL